MTDETSISLTSSTSTIATATTVGVTTTSIDRPIDPVPDLLAEVWSQYRSTARSMDGPGIAELVTEETFEWYDEVLDLALAADERTLLDDTSLSTAIAVVEVRAALGTDLLGIEDGRALMIARTDAGLTINDLNVDEFDRFSVASSHAFGQFGGIELVRFELVDGDWLIEASYSYFAFFDVPPLPDDIRADVISGGVAFDRKSLFDWFAGFLGTTWSAISNPIGTA